MPLVEFTFPAALKNVWEKKTGNPVPTESEMIDLDTAKADIPFEVDLNQLRNDTSLREMVRGTLAISLGMPQGSLATVPITHAVVLLGLLSRVNRGLVAEKAAKVGERLSRGENPRLVSYDDANDAMGSLQEDAALLRQQAQQACSDNAEATRVLESRTEATFSGVGQRFESVARYRENTAEEMGSIRTTIEDFTMRQQQQQQQTETVMQSLMAELVSLKTRVERQETRPQQHEAVKMPMPPPPPPLSHQPPMPMPPPLSHQPPVGMPPQPFQPPVVQQNTQPEPDHEEHLELITDPSCAKEVKAWEEILEAKEAATLVMKLDGRYVSGLKYGLGGDLLVEKFENLSNFLFGMERVTGWTQVPHLVKLGDDLLRQLRFQHFFCTDGTKRSELQEQLLIASEDPVEKANALIVKKKRARPPTFVKKLNVGNRFQFRPKGNAGGGSRLQAK